MRLSRLLPLLILSLLPVLPAAAIDRSADDYFQQVLSILKAVVLVFLFLSSLH